MYWYSLQLSQRQQPQQGHISFTQFNHAVCKLYIHKITLWIDINRKIELALKKEVKNSARFCINAYTEMKKKGGGAGGWLVKYFTTNYENEVSCFNEDLLAPHLNPVHMPQEYL